MSRSSKTLSRLGVAGVAAVTMGAGMPVFLASSAAAAEPAQLVINPNPGKAAAGTCQVFTVDVQDAAGAPATSTPTLTVQVSENPDSANQIISFCNPTTFANLAADTEQDSDTTAETAQIEVGSSRTASSGGTVTASTPTRATFGIRSSAPGGANIRVFIDTNNNDAFDAGEIQTLGSSTFTQGGTTGATQTAGTPGGNAAQDAAETLTPGETNSPVIAGDTATATVNVKNASGDNVSGVVVSFRVTAGPNGPQAATATTAATAGASGTAVTDNAGNAVIRFQTSGRTGTDTVQFFVNQTEGTTSGPDAGEPTATTTITVAPVPNRNAAEARNINLDPATTTTVAGDSKTFTATVTDAQARPVVGVTVTFREEGPGRFANGASVTQAVTNDAGIARVVTSSVAGETGNQIIVASLDAATTQCDEAAGAGTGATSTTGAGNCSDTSTQTFGAASPSPSASPSATTPSSPSPSPTASASQPPQGNSRLAISVSPATITPGVQSIVRVTGTPGSIIELQAYSRPSTDYVVVRRGTIGESGVIEFRVTPGTNTRLFAAVTGVANTESPSVVINVRTALSLTVVRNGRRDYTFQGRILPRRAGQLITLYRVTSDGREILTSQLRTDSTGTYRIRRVFTGSGTFGFLTRTGQTLTNAAGVSNGGRARPTAIF